MHSALSLIFVSTLLAFSMACPRTTLAEAIQISGPEGPLEAEMITVEGAKNVVVIIPGSGPTNRDGNTPHAGLASNMYKMLAQTLADHGIASLRIDKRGMFASSAALANSNAVTVGDYAEDARNWVRRAAEVAPCVWIAGHSEGGLVAMVAAQSPPQSLCGLILIATAGRPIGQVLLEQMRAMQDAQTLMPQIEAAVAEIEAGRRFDTSKLAEPLQRMFAESVQPYMIDLFAHDPAAIATSWRGPVLIVQGDADIQVKLVDAGILAKAMPQAKHIVLENMTHVMKTGVPGKPFATYIDPDYPLHSELASVISDFIIYN